MRETLARVELPTSGRVLDVGCGTGVLLERVARERPELELVGVDVSPEMLQRAGERFARVPLRSAHLLAGSAESLPLRDGAFDLVLSTSAMHFWRRPVDALRELRRVLRPGGRLVLTDWSREGWIMRLRDLRFRLTDPAHFRTAAPGEAAGMLEDAGWRVERFDRYRIPGRWGMMTAVAVARGG